MTVGAAEPLKAFRNEVTRRMSEWPFFYQSLEHQVIQVIFPAFLSLNMSKRAPFRARCIPHFYTILSTCTLWL